MLTSSAFLPLTLEVISGLPAGRPEPRALDTVSRQAERDARVTWQALVGDCDHPARASFATGLRRLTGAVGAFVGADWWDGIGSAHRDRVAGYQRWVEDALAESDGAGFASALAGYDDAVARALMTGAARPARDGRSTGSRPRSSGTMAGWAKQARAATYRAALPLRRVSRRAATPLRWATSRPATSSSKWSRRSRSAG